MCLPFGVLAFWSAGDTDFKNLSLGVSTCWSGCLCLWVSPPFHHGVPAFWSASDTDFRNLSSNFHVRVVSTFWSASDRLQKSKFRSLHLFIRVCLPLVVSTFWSWDLCLLISKWHWLQKPKFGSLRLLIRVSLPLGISTFWSWCL